MPLTEFIAKYGEKGYIVLKAVLEASRRARIRSLGDFSLQDVKKALAERGINYNPSLLLSKLEREYGVIETSYRSSGQRWWRIIDRSEIEEAIREWEGEPESDREDPRLRLLRIQFYSINPHEILEVLVRLSRRRRLTRQEAEKLRKIAFQDLPLLVEFLEKASAEYPDELVDEIALAESILELAEELTVARGGRGESLELALRNRVREPL